MKILHIVPSYKPAYIYGGPIESISRLCEGTASTNNLVHVFTTTANGKTELDVKPGEFLNVDGVQVIYFKRITKDHTHISSDLWKHLNKHCKEYDIIHIHSWWNILVIVAAWICHFNKVKVVVSPRGMLSNYILMASNSLAKKWLHKLAGKKALEKAYFHATAQSELEECQNLIPNWRGFLLPNILSLPEIDIKKNDNLVFTLIFLSRIHPKKGIELLFKAISQLPFKVKLKIAGSGEDSYTVHLKTTAKELNISKSIEWLGWQSRQSKFLELMQSDLFVLTSYNENFANVVIESLHMGTPVLISEQVGLASFVKDNDLGWVTELTVNSITDNLMKAFLDKKKRQTVHEQGRNKIKESFSEQFLVNKYLEQYQNYI